MPSAVGYRLFKCYGHCAFVYCIMSLGMHLFENLRLQGFFFFFWDWLWKIGLVFKRPTLHCTSRERKRIRRNSKNPVLFLSHISWIAERISDSFQENWAKKKKKLKKKPKRSTSLWVLFCFIHFFFLYKFHLFLRSNIYFFKIKVELFFSSLDSVDRRPSAVFRHVFFCARLFFVCLGVRVKIGWACVRTSGRGCPSLLFPFGNVIKI